MSKEKDQQIKEPELFDADTGEVINSNPSEETLISGAEYWDFEKNPEFVGYYKRVFEREKDHESYDPKSNDPKKFDANLAKGAKIGYIFEDQNGEEHIISNSYLVDKGIEKAEERNFDFENKYMKIIFIGKGKNGSGQNFNKFKINIES